MNTDFEKQSIEIRTNIGAINYRRMKCFSVVLFGLVSIILLIDNNNRISGLWTSNHAYKLLFYLHVSFLFIAGLGIFISSLTQTRQKDIFFLIYIFVGFNLSTMLSGWVSPYINGQISVYIISCFCTATLFSLRPRYSIILYLQTYIVLVSGLYINQIKLETFQGNLMNASLVFLMALFISNIIFRFTENELFYKYNLEHLVKEQTSALLNANQSLRFEISERERIQTEKIEQLTKYLHLEAELSRSNQLIADIIKNMPDSFFALDKNLDITYLNRAGEITFAITPKEMAGRKMTQLSWVADSLLKQLYKVLQEKMSLSFEFFSKELGDKWFEVSAYPLENGMTCYFRDITVRKITEEEIARLDRLNLVGQLASGIAHEIRNPLSVVRGYLQLLSEKTAYREQLSTFDLMISELDRANAIITEFLSLAQIKQTGLKSKSLNEILNNLYPLLEADAINQNKKIYFLQGDIPNLKFNSNEISQMVLNLVRNGLESMEERQSLTIKSYLENNMAVLEIIDEGCGISQENFSKLGTPFFTTKDYGTGLGLATSYRIAESHNAKIRINSSSCGTSFCVLFPIPNEGQDQSEYGLKKGL